MRVAIAAVHAEYGNSPGVYKALKTQVKDVRCFFKITDRKGFAGELTSERFAQLRRKKFDEMIIIGGGAFELLSNRNYIKNNARIILTDSYYLKYRHRLNVMLKKHKVYIMPDIRHFYPGQARLFYPPFEMDREVEKNETLTVSHSPANFKKMYQKGTNTVRYVVERVRKKVNFDFKLITDVDRNEALTERAKSHVFIDQYLNGKYLGGIGKSGIEGMASECVVLSSGNPVGDNDIPAAPYVSVNSNFEEKLYECLVGEREKQIQKQNDWLKYVSYKFVGKHLLR